MLKCIAYSADYVEKPKDGIPKRRFHGKNPYRRRDSNLQPFDRVEFSTAFAVAFPVFKVVSLQTVLSCSGPFKWSVLWGTLLQSPASGPNQDLDYSQSLYALKELAATAWVTAPRYRDHLN